MRPFSEAANAILEYTDELIGQILSAMPKEALFALVSDHGLVNVEKTVHLAVGRLTPFLAIADDSQTAGELERLSRDPANGIGRRIPPDEWRRFQPDTLTRIRLGFPALGNRRTGRTDTGDAHDEIYPRLKSLLGLD